MVNRILLSPGEYELFDTLDGDRLKKTRYYHRHLGRIFSVDQFEGELDGLVMCETEAADQAELMVIKPPSYAKLEVTDDPFFEGGHLCRTTRAELMRKLATLNY
jgi:CYTH domain-containing protein